MLSYLWRGWHMGFILWWPHTASRTELDELAIIDITFTSSCKPSDSVLFSRSIQLYRIKGWETKGCTYTFELVLNMCEHLIYVTILAKSVTPFAWPPLITWKVILSSLLSRQHNLPFTLLAREILAQVPFVVLSLFHEVSTSLLISNLYFPAQWYFRFVTR